MMRLLEILGEIGGCLFLLAAVIVIIVLAHEAHIAVKELDRG